MVTPFEYEVECPKCQQRQLAVEHAEHIQNDPPWDEDPSNRFAVASCKMCYSVLVLKQAIELDDNFKERWRRRQATVIWPQYERVLGEAIPAIIRREHHEARSCLKAGAHTAAIVMVRRTLEGVCADHGVTTKPLVRALEEMKNQGLIEGRLLVWAQELRVLGNEAAHFTGNAIARQDAQDALDLAEALMDYLYVFTARFDAFKKRRTPSENASGGGTPTPG